MLLQLVADVRMSNWESARRISEHVCVVRIDVEMETSDGRTWRTPGGVRILDSGEMTWLSRTRAPYWHVCRRS